MSWVAYRCSCGRWFISAKHRDDHARSHSSAKEEDADIAWLDAVDAALDRYGQGGTRAEVFQMLSHDVDLARATFREAYEVYGSIRLNFLDDDELLLGLNETVQQLEDLLEIDRTPAVAPASEAELQELRANRLSPRLRLLFAPFQSGLSVALRSQFKSGARSTVAAS